ncbi:MAG: glucosaminidase domain-containing protein [Spirochaetaceae bacterium]|nr:glucosaminidase domain-containing protein [Spirochaetaceae bacterium]
MCKRFYIIFSWIFLFLVFSCTTLPKQNKVSQAVPSIYIDAQGTKSPQQLFNFFISKNPNASYEKVMRLAEYYVTEGNSEGINSDVAFVQMCLETGFLKFGGLVTENMNNFCGLGSIDKNNPGNSFETELLGVRAHIQHLHAYGTTRDLNKPLIDPRYKYVNPRGKAPTIQELTGTWAADKEYGAKLQSLLNQLSAF